MYSNWRYPLVRENSRTQRRGVMLTDEIGLAGEMSSYFKHRPSLVSLYREQSAALKLETSSVLQVSTIKHSLLQSFVFVALFIDRNVKKPWKLDVVQLQQC